MAIRIRKVNGVTVALCAAETDPQEGDIYLDDNVHYALSTKFALDWESEGLIVDPPIDETLVPVMESQKLRDAKEELEKWLKEQNV